MMDCPICKGTGRMSGNSLCVVCKGVGQVLQINSKVNEQVKELGETQGQKTKEK